MTIRLIPLVALSATLVAAPLLAQDVPDRPSAPDAIHLRALRATLETPRFEGVYVIREDFDFATVGNPQRQAFEPDNGSGRIRVTPAGQPALWLACASIEPIPGYCEPTAGPPPLTVIDLAEQRPRRMARGPVNRIPECPGDPRCP